MAGEEMTGASEDEDDSMCSNGAAGTNPTTSSAQPLERVLAMGTGDAHGSYSKNSRGQAFVVQELVLPQLCEALELVDRPSHGAVLIADLGCSSGANTIATTAFIVETLKARFTDAKSTLPDFQAFFNDLPSNDFNNLFQLLSTDLRVTSSANGQSMRNFLCAGVPGSFYGRLFPRSSVHVFYSAFGVHWLSKIPAAVINKESPAYNKGRVWINGSSLETATAYKEQAASDLTTFLEARAAELAPGGLLFLFMNGRLNSEPNLPIDNPFVDSMWNAINDTWSELVSEGILTEEQRSTFNLPIYFRTRAEVLEAVESCGSAFHVRMCKMKEVSMDLQKLFSGNSGELSQIFAAGTKSLINAILEANIGKETSEIYWDHFEKSMERNAIPKILTEKQCYSVLGLTITLTRK